MLDQNIKQQIAGKEGTLICDGWNNKRRKHLVAMMITVDSTAYSTRVFDNTADYRGGKLMAKQMEEEMQRLSAYGVAITGICTDDGPDQVSLVIIQILVYYTYFF